MKFKIYKISNKINKVRINIIKWMSINIKKILKIICKIKLNKIKN